ncbi:MAG: dephospho-CoA kinase [Gammaproteobacteria bacterium]|nr:dephospho-CoA kinase [Gammaproteobacteria bacterium]
MKVIGLTGGIASGKSTAASYLSGRGAYIIDADKLGHAAYGPETPAFEQVVATFGQAIVDGSGHIDRKALGARVFGENNRLKELTDIVWPAIRRLAEARIEEHRAKQPYSVVVLEAAVLFEAGWEDAVDEVWVVIAEHEIAIRRAIARDGVDRAAVEARLAAQLSNEQRRARADVVIDNCADEHALIEQLDAHWQRLVGQRLAGQQLAG